MRSEREKPISFNQQFPVLTPARLQAGCTSRLHTARAFRWGQAGRFFVRMREAIRNAWNPTGTPAGIVTTRTSGRHDARTGNAASYASMVKYKRQGLRVSWRARSAAFLMPRLIDRSTLYTIT